MNGRECADRVVVERINRAVAAMAPRDRPDALAVRLVLRHLGDWARGDTVADSIDQMADALVFGPRTVRRCLAALELAGLVVTVTRGGRGRPTVRRLALAPAAAVPDQRPRSAAAVPADQRPREADQRPRSAANTAFAFGKPLKAAGVAGAREATPTVAGWERPGADHVVHRRPPATEGDRRAMADALAFVRRHGTSGASSPPAEDSRPDGGSTSPRHTGPLPVPAPAVSVSRVQASEQRLPAGPVPPAPPAPPGGTDPGPVAPSRAGRRRRGYRGNTWSPRVGRR